MKLPGEMKPITFAQKIGSRMEEAESLCLKIRDLLQSSGLSQAVFPVELLARECLVNAVTHGNGNDADKFILLSLTVSGNRICLEVTDEGPGFAWRKARRNKLDKDKCGGRGLAICELYAERVRFNRAGNKIALWVSSRGGTGNEDEKMAAYVIEQKGRQGSVRLNGDLTAVLVPELQAALKGLLNQGACDLEFDLGGAAMLDSSGMGLMIAASNSLAASGGKVRITNVCPDIFRLLQSMRLTARLNVSGRAG